MLGLLVEVSLEARGQDADFGNKFLCKAAVCDTHERSHHEPNETVRDENEPEELAEQFQVVSTLEYEASVGKADEDTPECVAENGRVGEGDGEGEVGDVEVLAPKESVNVVG